MFADDEKSLVAENCLEYDSKYIFHSASFTNLARNCVSCQNYINGECTKNMFDKLYERLSRN